MASEKGKKGSKKAQPSRDDIVLRLRSDPRSEKRFEPKNTPSAVISMVALSIGAVLVGAGTYGQWLRSEALGPHPWSPWLLAAGAAVFLAAVLLGPRTAFAVRVGDAGVGLEKSPSELERLGWNTMTRIALGSDALTLHGEGMTVAIPLPAMAEAAGKVLREARVRRPLLVEDIEPSAIEKADETGSETVALESPQVAGLKCKASDKIIAFEKDARLCGRCGELYGKDSVPKRCVTCDARLK